MTIIIIILLILAIIYLYYQNRQLKTNGDNSAFANSPQKIFELDEDLIADKDLAIRERNEAQQEALSLNNRLKLKQQEVTRKDNEITRLKQEVSQKEISLNSKLKELKKTQQEQLKAINVLFDPQAESYSNIDFQGLYSLLASIAQQNKDLPGSFPGEDK